MLEFKDVMALFGETEIFIFVFMELTTKTYLIQRVILHRANRRDYLVFILVFGGFSIFGTYVGIPLLGGAVSNIRDFSPILAGLVAGPWVGLAVGLFGGVHRFFMGGITNISCGLATICAGLIAGGFYMLNKGRPFKVWQGMLIAVLIEGFHGALTLLIARPFDQALEIVKLAIPAMAVANSLGIAIGLILSEHIPQEQKFVGH
jgi:LytS/YehU family sensor histidine kinase